MDDQIDLELDKYPLHLSFGDWRFRRQIDLEERFPNLSGREVLLRMSREERARDEARSEQQSAKRSSPDARKSIPLIAHIGRRIAAERTYKRTKQLDLARVLGIPQASMSDIERGRRPATAAELILIAKELGCALESFVPQD